MKICFVLGGLKSGGIGRVVSILANRLAKQYEDCEVHILTTCPPEENEIYKLDPIIKRDYLVEEYTSMKKILFRFTRRLRKYLKENNIDIVIGCGNIYYLPVLLASQCISKNICWEHSNVYNNNDNQGQTILRKLASRFSNKVVTLTETDRKGYIEKFNARRVHKIYNPVDSKLFNYKNDTKNINPKTRKIITVGRLSYQKQLEIIPKIANEFIRNYNDCVWHIYGSGELEKEIKKEIKKYNLEEKIILKGQVSNLYELYSDYSLIVMTSRYEGFPMTLLEGAANGLPMVSFNILTGPNEIIENGVNGFLIKPFNVKDIASKIDTILSNDKVRENMSRESIKTAKLFNEEKIVEEWYELLQTIIEE